MVSGFTKRNYVLFFLLGPVVYLFNDCVSNADYMATGRLDGTE
jgi:hypothetical protein